MDIEVVYDIVKEIREEQKEHSKTLTQLEVSIAKMQVNVEANTKDVAYHIHRTNLLEDLHKDNARKIDILSSPMTVKELTKKTSLILTISCTFVTIIYTVLKIMKVLP